MAWFVGIIILDEESIVIEALAIKTKPVSRNQLLRYLYPMKSDDQILESLLAGGLIGATLGALLSKDKEDGDTIGAIAGAAILATYRANEQAMQSNVPVMIEENGKIYLLHPGGQKEFIRQLPKSTILIQNQYKLK